MKITCDDNGIVKWDDSDVVNPFAAKNINLLQKESTMKTRFAVVNLEEKVKFEKKWEMPYGYNNCPYIGFSQKEAIQWINQNLGQQERREYVVERHKAGMIEVVWKIMPGHRLAGEKEDEWDDEDF